MFWFAYSFMIFDIVVVVVGDVFGVSCGVSDVKLSNS